MCEKKFVKISHVESKNFTKNDFSHFFRWSKAIIIQAIAVLKKNLKKLHKICDFKKMWRQKIVVAKSGDVYKTKT